MNYAIRIRASSIPKKLEADIKKDFTCPVSLAKQQVFAEKEITGSYRANFNIERKVKGTQKIAATKDEPEHEVEVDNRQDIIETIKEDLKSAAWYRAEIHCCSHDEGINRPCSPWQVIAEKGAVLEEEESP